MVRDSRSRSSSVNRSRSPSLSKSRTEKRGLKRSRSRSTLSRNSSNRSRSPSLPKSRRRDEKRSRRRSRSGSRSTFSRTPSPGAKRLHIGKCYKTKYAVTFLGNLDDSIRRCDIEDVFGKYGRIVDCWMARYSIFYYVSLNSFLVIHHSMGLLSLIEWKMHRKRCVT